jgi:hypothetical protein
LLGTEAEVRKAPDRLDLLVLERVRVAVQWPGGAQCTVGVGAVPSYPDLAILPAFVQQR